MKKTVFVAIAFILGFGIYSLPLPQGLTAQGHMLLAILAGMLVLWVAEAVNFSSSSFFLLGFMALGAAFTENPQTPGKMLGAAKGLHLAMQGFASSAWILVVCALFLAAAVDLSGLGRRMSLHLLALMGSTPRRIRMAALVLTLLLSVVIPSPAATAGLSTVLMVSVMKLLKLPPKENFAKGLFLIAAFGPVLGMLSVLTSGGGPVQTASFILQSTGHELTWIGYFINGFPLTLSMAAVLFLLLEKLFPVPENAAPEMRSQLREAIDALEPLSRREKGIAAILALVIPLWASSKVLHPVDNSILAMLAVALLYSPGVWAKNSYPTFEDLSARVSWGTLMLFGSVLSLGQALLDSGAAAWLARATLVRMGVAEWPLLAMIGGAGLVFAIFALAFSARSAAIGALTPTIIGFAQSLPPERQIPVWGLALVLNYPIQFSVLFPANSPMAMIAYSSNTFEDKDLLRLALPLMIISLGLVVVLSATWWRLLGLLP